jgi:hypothetical protein
MGPEVFARCTWTYMGLHMIKLKEEIPDLRRLSEVIGLKGSHDCNGVIFDRSSGGGLTRRLYGMELIDGQRRLVDRGPNALSLIGPVLSAKSFSRTWSDRLAMFLPLRQVVAATVPLLHFTHVHRLG